LFRSHFHKTLDLKLGKIVELWIKPQEIAKGSVSGFLVCLYCI